MYTIHLVYFTRNGDFTWNVSDCEGLSGGYSQEMMGGGGFRVYSEEKSHLYVYINVTEY